MSESDVVIRVEGLGKKYDLHHETSERYTALRDVMTSQARAAGRLLNPFTLLGQLRKAQREAVAERAESEEEFWALKGVSFEIRRGERVGIIGRNGAGKSTLLKILSRITEPTTGRVEIRGRVASLLEVGTGFHPELTGQENIYLNGAILGMTRREIRAKFEEIVDFAEVEKFLDTPVKRYSSGMYVRLAFAVAAHLEPEILVVDEVLAVGDASFQKKCLGKMESVSKDTGRTVLFVSHNLAAISKLCNAAIVLQSGSIACLGRVDNCVNSYLSLSAGGLKIATQRWSNNSIDPEIDLALQSCGCSQSGSNGLPVLTDNTDITIWIRLVIRKPVKDFQIALIITSESGEVIIHTQSDASENFSIPQQKQNCSIAYTIPRRSLKTGVYLLSIYGVIPNVTRVFAHEKVVSFAVESSSSAVTRHAASAWRGALSPCFGEWTKGPQFSSAR